TTTTAAPVENPSIAADQADYTPGSTVTLTGTGWAPNEAIHLFVNDDVGATWSYSTDVTSNQSGNFTTSFQLSSTLIAQYKVTATGTFGDIAFTTFTDNVNTDFSQCANEDKLPLGECVWINGILGDNQSQYFEGMSTLQRLIFDGVGTTSGNVHTLTF